MDTLTIIMEGAIYTSWLIFVLSSITESDNAMFYFGVMIIGAVFL